jgi:hypothetical protein
MPRKKTEVTLVTVRIALMPFFLIIIHKRARNE